MQSIITFGGLAILFIILAWIPVLGWALGAIIWVLEVVLWILLMVKAYQGVKFKLPFVGDLAEKWSA